MKNYMNRYVRIVHRKTGQTICCGKCIAQKLKGLQLVSIDNKYFFHIENSPSYYIQDCEEGVGKMVFEMERFRGILTMKKFAKAMAKIVNKSEIPNEIYDIDVFVENNENELDKQMVDIVRALNRIKGLRTTGSCSGHYLRKPWVLIEMRTLEAVNELNMIVNLPQFCNHFMISNDSKIRLIRGAYPSMILYCRKRLPFAVKHLEKLVEYIDGKYE